MAISKSQKKQIKQSQKESIHASYALGTPLGEGGNGRVYQCSRLSDKQGLAIKVLEEISEEKMPRFREEIAIMAEWGPKIPGIMPIIDNSKEHFWYTMPVAEPVMEKIKTCRNDARYKARAIVLGVRQVARTLAKLHERGIAHRDIKPDNLYWYNGRFTIGDFGLVELPDSPEDLTQSNRPLGAIFTIAPEMKRYPKLADGSKADVYSLAKTLWMLLTEDGKGFEGKYDWRDEQHALTNYGVLKELHLVGIEELLQNATSNDPDARPSMREFDKALAEWERTEKSELLSQKHEWEFLARYMFGEQIPRTAVYESAQDIVAILNMIGKRHAYNHMFMPSGGGDDLTCAVFAGERGCICIKTNLSVLIVKPLRLHIEILPESEWNYFLLETDALVPIEGVEEDCGCQDLVEDYPGCYVPATYAQYGVYDYDSGVPYPTGWQKVIRYTGGKFLITPKLGPYNQDGATYDARHNRVAPEAFREYMDESYRHSKNMAVPRDPRHQGRNTILNEKSPLTTTVAPKTDDGVSSSGFFRDKYATVDFLDLTSSLSSPNNDGFDYCICFPHLLDPYVSMFEVQRKLYLMANGRLEIHDGFPKKVFIAHCRDEALGMLSRVARRLQIVCAANGVAPSSELSGCVKWRRKDKPTHLFTRAELVKVLKEGDDRKFNQLVIDGNGNILLVDPASRICPYPVSFETFSPGNRNVGRYSTWTTEKYDMWYQTALCLWLEHLETKRPVYFDYEHEANEQTLVAKIRSFY